MILDRPNCFGRVQIVLVEAKSFWLGTNHFGQVEIGLLWTNFYNLDLCKMILDHPNCFGRVQIVLVGSKLFWLGPNHFGQVQN